MKRRYRMVVAAIACSVFAGVLHAEDASPRSITELLTLVRQGQAEDALEAREREARFLADRDAQQQELARVRTELAARQKRSAELEKRFDANETRIADARQRLSEKLGSLTELLGHLTAAAGEARDGFGSSLSAVELGAARVEHTVALIERAGSGVELPTMSDLENFWYELQREMAAGGEVHAFEASVVRPDGSRSQTPVVRVGVFNIVSAAGDYLQYDVASGALSQLARQPQQRLVAAAAELARSTQGLHGFGLDPSGPSGGGFLAALTAAPSFSERVQQGGLIGYLIMALGACAAVLASYRYAVLLRMRQRVGAQLGSARANPDNPLGRVLAVHEANPTMDAETLELKLSEAVIRELPAIERGLSLLRIIATVAPLLGLLGTVTGMIMTFQSITIFGAGDPKAMAGGISQALVTTVQGLCVAIPVVFVHALLASRVRRITQILEEETTGLLAEHTGHVRGEP
ncbi:MAG: MotA/TolQ/ExbB proton channel family protein [Pseudomonadales bacterium]|jgi:biopolymer transport protein ExbB|nr:MotA/TolQ/ExbB proton channel family protein [Pseudomonadales bacterium]MCP5336221.1 MotA/TolQ/ExbB proton channel family protein [Pseudomonadales bacterium]